RVIELEYNGTAQSMQSKLHKSDKISRKIRPLHFRGRLSWVKDSYKDITRTPSEEDCPYTSDWRCWSLHMEPVLEENNLVVDVTIPDIMDDIRPTSIDSARKTRQSISTSPQDSSELATMKTALHYKTLPLI